MLRLVSSFLCLTTLLLALPLQATAFKPNSIIFNSIMKSGSTYIVQELKEGLNYTIEAIHQTPYNQYWKEFSRKDHIISKQHCVPTTEYITALKKYDQVKMVVHIRDPRQAIVSLAYYYNHPKERQFWKRFGLPQGYYTMTWSQQLDWNIEHKLPDMVAFIEGWIAIKDQEDKKHDGIQILLTTYDELITDELKLFNKILAFYAIPPSEFNYVILKKDESVLYRKGDVDEWRKVLSATQKKRIAEIVPERLLSRLNWHK